jgi:Ca2+ transporting ATPase
MMQIFNEINARKINPDEINVFKGFFNNPFFLLIIVISVVVQIALVEVGGSIVKVVPLTWEKHLICVGIGAFSLVWGNYNCLHVT